MTQIFVKNSKYKMHFKYMPKKTNNKKKSFNKNKKYDNPFSVLTNVNYN